jgi:hypothetical protein
MKSKLRAAVGLLLVAGGCAGNSCSCAQPLPNGFPAEQRHSNAVQVRITDTGFAFLESNVSDVVGALVPGGLNFTVPEMCGGTISICCMQPAAECAINIDLVPQSGDPPRLEVDPQTPPGNRLHVTLRARIVTPGRLKASGSGSDCWVTINTEGEAPDSVTVIVDADFTQDQSIAAGQPGTTRLDISSVTINDLNNGDITIDPVDDCWSDPLCCAGDWDFVKGFIIDQARSQIEDQVRSAVTDQLCKQCAAAGECAPFATCNGNGVCELPGGACLQELGTSGRIQARDLLAAFSPGQEGAADIYDVAGGYARSNNAGLSLGVLSGAIPPDGVGHPCVPGDTPPTDPGMQESTLFQGNTGPQGAFHVGIGLHEYMLNQNAWAMYEGGVLCINAGTRSIDLLNSGALGIIFGSLGDLTHGENVPVILGLRPQKRPVLTLGAGTFNTDGSILEPLITVNLPELQIDFFALIDQRYVRLLTLQADVVLPIGLDIDDTGQIVPVIGDVEDAFTNLVVTNSELLDESPQQLADTFPTLLGLALPFLGSALGGFDLPTLGGIEIQIAPGGITSVEGNTMLALFGNLAVASPKPGRAVTRAAITSVRQPPIDAYATLDPAQRPTVELELGGEGRDGTDRDLEWQVRIDGGFWHPYTRSRRLILDDAVFWMPGTHRIEVRSRQVRLPETTSEIVMLSATLDPRGDDDEATLGFHGRVPSESGCGCRVAPSGSSRGATAAVLAGALALIAWAWRRHRVVALALVAALAPGCNCGSDESCSSPEGAVAIEAGAIGRWSDVAASGDDVMVSAYDERYGDLVVGKLSEEGTLQWHTADGVPQAAVVGICDGYRGGVMEPGDDVGAWTSIAIVDGRSLVAYQDRGAKALKLARETGTNDWTSYVVDAKPGEEIGLYASLSVDSQKVPGIAYMATNVDDGMNGKKAQLRWAQASRSNPGSGDWTIETIAEVKIPCTGLCAAGLVCVAETDVCTATDTSCPAECAADVEACVAGACVAIRPDTSLKDIPEGTGLFASAGRLGDGTAVVAFHDRSTGDLNLAVHQAGLWTIVPLDASTDGDTGQWASLAVAGDAVHVAYQDAVGDRLLAVSWSGGTVGAIEVVDNGRREGERPHSVGANASLVATPSGLLVAYQDQMLSDLLVAKRATDGTWTWQSVAQGAPGYGFFTSAAMGERVWVSNYVYDRAAPILGDIRLVNPP